MPTTSFTQLDVWKKTRILTGMVYKITERFPQDQLFAITSQMQRAVLSIGCNIAEGYGRRTGKDKARFFTISKGSAEELNHLLIVAGDLGYWKEDPAVMQTLDDVAGMLRRLIDRTLELF